jgi:hypothetical protein
VREVGLVDEMDVGVDQPGNDELAPGVEDGPGRARRLAAVAHRDDAPVADDDGLVGREASGDRVEDGGVADGERLGPGGPGGGENEGEE